MKKTYLTKITLIALVALVFGAGTISAQTYSGGAGTMDDPFLISSNQDLLDLDTARAQWDTVVYYKLTTDLDMKGETFMPLGYDNGAKLYFRGHIDGDNHVIKNLNITQHADAAAEGKWNMGFMGIAEAAKIKNLGLDSLTLAVANKLGGFIGEGRWGCVIENCFIINSVVDAGGGGYVGAAVGNADGIEITNSLFEVEVKGGWRVGGLIGCKAWGTVDVNAVSIYTVTAKGDAIIGSTQGSVKRDSVVNTYYKYTGADREGDTLGVELTPKEMTVQANFVGYSFDTAWVMKTGGFPVLSSFPIAVFDNLENPDNDAPVADAGAAQNAEGGSTVELDGSASYDPDGDAITYSWVSIDASITLTNPTEAKASFVAPATEGDYKFELTVSDGTLDSEADTVVISVVGEIPTDTIFVEGWTAECPQSEREPATNALDNDKTTMFTTDWEDTSLDFPFNFIIDLGDNIASVSHFIYVPRQDLWGPNGTVKDYELYVSNSKDNWGDAVASGTFNFPTYVDGIDKELYKPEKLVKLPEVAEGQYVKFVSLSSINSNLDPASPKIEMTMAELYLFGSVEAKPVDPISVNKTNEVNFSVYPNPSNGIFNVVAENNIQVVVKDMLGRVVASELFEAGKNTLDISSYGTGVYLMTVQEGNNVSTRTILVD